MTWAILIVAVCTLGVSVAAVVISIKRGNADRVEIREIANAAQAEAQKNTGAIGEVASISEQTRDAAIATKLTAELTHALELRQLRIDALNEYDSTLDRLEGLLRLLPNVVDQAGFARCAAQFQSCLVRIDMPLSHCQRLAKNNNPWAHSAIVNDIANARVEVNAALVEVSDGRA